MAADKGLPGEAIVHGKIFSVGRFLRYAPFETGASAFFSDFLFGGSFRSLFGAFFAKKFFCQMSAVRGKRQTRERRMAEAVCGLENAAGFASRKRRGGRNAPAFFLCAQFLREGEGLCGRSFARMPAPLEKLLRAAFGRRLQYAEIRAMEGNVLTVFMPAFGV